MLSEQEYDRLRQLQRVQEEHQRLWVERYPNYCKHCGGFGKVSWQENRAPLGSGAYWPETIEDLCDQCLGNSVCPRCHAELPDPMIEDIICPHCEWQESDPDGLPQVLTLYGDNDDYEGA